MENILKSISGKTIPLDEFNKIYSSIFASFSVKVKPNESGGSYVSAQRVIRDQKNVIDEPIYQFETDKKIEDFKVESPKITGKLMFKFDNDEPHELADVTDFGTTTIQLKQEKNGYSSNSITWTSKEGKKFELFIEPIEKK